MKHSKWLKPSLLQDQSGAIINPQSATDTKPNGNVRIVRKHCYQHNPQNV